MKSLRWRWVAGMSVPVVLLIILAAVAMVMRQGESSQSDNDRALKVYGAIHANGTWNLIHGMTNDTGVLKVLSGPLDDGLAVIISNNDATFWTTDDEIYVVNSAAKELLPNAPQAPPKITDEAVRVCAK